MARRSWWIVLGILLLIAVTGGVLILRLCLGQLQGSATEEAGLVSRAFLVFDTSGPPLWLRDADSPAGSDGVRLSLPVVLEIDAGTKCSIHVPDDRPLEVQVGDRLFLVTTTPPAPMSIKATRAFFYFLGEQLAETADDAVRPLFLFPDSEELERLLGTSRPSSRGELSDGRSFTDEQAVNSTVRRPVSGQQLIRVDGKIVMMHVGHYVLGPKGQEPDTRRARLSCGEIQKLIEGGKLVRISSLPGSNPEPLQADEPAGTRREP